MAPRSIAILAPSPVPFQSGGAEKFWYGLREALANNTNALVELIKLPAPEDNFKDIVASYEMFSKLDLNHFDMLITSKYPAWMCAHPNHVCYMLHPLRGLYDFYPRWGLPVEAPNPGGHLTELLEYLSNPSPTREDLEPLFELVHRALKDRTLPFSIFSLPAPLIHNLVHFLDRIALQPSAIKAWLSISGTVAKRPGYFPSDAQIRILPPPSELSNFTCRNGEYFFTASRMSPDKRINLLVEAMAHFPLDIPLRIAGTGAELEKLRKQAQGDSRIQFLGHVPDSEMADLYSRAIAVPFVPYEEDYGLITVEAMKSGKPVITASDSGGVCEMVAHGKTGLITDPTPQSIARAMTMLARDRALAAKMGAEAAESVASINWKQTALDLMEHVASCQQKRYPPLLAVAPFRADKNGGGGNRRLYHYCNQLSSSFDVHLVCYRPHGPKTPETVVYGPHFRETSIPWSAEILEEADNIQKQTGECADDIAMLRHASNDPLLIETLRQKGEKASGVILCHPWLYPALSATLPHLPVIFDALNVEADIKEHQYGDSRELLETRKIEQTVCKEAKLISALSEADANKLQALYQPSTAPLVLPPGCEERAPLPPKAVMRKRLPYAQAKLVLFIGSYHAPNLEAAFSIAGMAPLIPEAEFLIGGSVCSARELSNSSLPDNVHLIGQISEKAKNILLRAADLALNPVVSGSGVNLKSIEYIFWSIPLISTPFGMRGLPANLEPAVHIRELDQFPATIRQLLATPPDEEAIEKIRSKFTESYLWSNILSPLTPAVKAVLPAPESSARNGGTGAPVMAQNRYAPDN